MSYKISFPDMISTLVVQSYHMRVAEPGWNYREHYHKTFEILYCCEGYAVQQVAGKPVDFRKGDLLIIPSGIRHSVINPGRDNYVYLSFLFDIDDHEFRQWFQTLTQYKWNSTQIESLNKQFADLDEFVKNSVLALTKSTGSPEATEHMILVKERFRIQAIILTVLYEIIDASLRTSSPHPAAHHRKSYYEVETAYRIEKYILEHFHSPTISINQIAKQFCMSRAQCHRLFLKVFKVSPRQYLTNKRLQRAKYLLLHTDWKIQMISERLGFASQSHFSRQFKRWTGVSPLKYRPKILYENQTEEPKQRQDSEVHAD